MKIKSLRLQNIKSYQDETITFYDGVNFISGLNGAGKTTIIESIGYALFDCKPGTLNQFVRYGAKTGTITVEFEAPDGYPYKVVRKVGSVSSWLVYDGMTGAELDLHGAADVKPWLKECLGVDRDQDLAQLFSDVVGVSQGTFTAPFLETPANRRQKFNKMLKVESYNEAFAKSREVVGELNQRIAEAEKEMARLEERVKGYHEVKTQVEELKPQLQELERLIAVQQKELASALKRRDELRQTKTWLEQKSRALEILKVEIEGLRERLAQLKENLSKAQEAAQKLKEVQEGYQAFVAGQKALAQLEKERQERDRLNQHLSRLQQDIKAKEGAWEAAQQAWQKQQKENEEKLSAVKTLQEQKEQEVQEAQKSWQAVEELNTLLDHWQGQLNGLAQKQKLLAQYFSRLQDGREKWAALRQEIKTGQEKLTSLEEVEKKLEKQAALEKQLEQKRLELSALSQKLATLEENRQQSAGGLCPFLNSPCQNVGGDLNRYFTEQINQTQKQWEQVAQEVQRLEKEGAQKEVLTQTLSNLEAQKLNLQHLYKEEERYLETFSQLFEKTLEVDLQETLNQLEGEGLDLEKTVAATLGSSVSLAAELTRVGQEVKKGFSTYVQEVKTSISALTPGVVEQLTQRLQELLDRVELFQERGEDFFQGLNRLVAAEGKARNALLGRVLGEQNSLAKQEQELLYKREQLAQEKKVQEEKAQALVQLKAEEEKLQQELEKYGALEQKLEAVQKLISQHQRAYEIYMQYQEEARKVASLEVQVQEGETAVAQKQKAYEDLALEVQNVSQSYREEELTRWEEQVENLKIQVATQEQLRKERHGVLEQLKQKLQELEATKKQLEELTAQREKSLRTKELLEYVRSVFNRAGERVAHVYRQYLSHEANRLYREVAQENVTLEWGEDYEIILADSHQGKERVRVFRQLSGGEQMTAALAVRLALLGQLSGVNLGFFDEPTTNLDSQRRDNLAQIIPKITQGFDQLFVISHDDSFDAMTDNVIELKKDSGQGTKCSKV